MALACITFDHLGTAEQMARLRDVAERHGVAAAFYVTGEQASTDPSAVKALAVAGHEVGTHGWAHEDWAALDPVTERALLARATSAVADATGAPPLGFRAPGGGRSDATAAILDELGYAYDASLGDSMRAGRLSPRIAQVPFVWPGVDGYWYLRDEPADPGAVRDGWLATLDRVAGRPDALFLTICHPEITGADPARVAALDAVVAAVAADRRVEVVTPAAIAARIPA